MPIVVKSSQPATASQSTAFVNTVRTTATGAGDQTLITAVADKRIVVLSLMYVQITSGVVTFKSGATTRFSLSALNTAQIEMDAGGWPVCVCGVGEAFVSNHAGSGSLITAIRYLVVD